MYYILDKTNSTNTMTLAKTSTQNTMPDTRTPRYSEEAECSVIGGLILNNKAADDVIEIVSEADFYRKEHQYIFRAITQLTHESKPLDVLTVCEALKKMQLFDQAGGKKYLADIVVTTPSAANIKAYATIVREQSVLRQLIAASNTIITDAYNPDGRAVRDLLDTAQEKILKVAEQHDSGEGPQPINMLMQSTISLLQERAKFYAENKNALIGTTSGFRRLDAITNGFQPGNMIVVAARPSMGKTSLAMNLVENAVIKTGKPVIVFSLEMPAEEVTMRLLASLSRINLGNLARGDIDAEGWTRLTSAISLIRNKPLHIDDQGGLTPYELRARVRRIAKEYNGELGLVMIDYMQLMSLGGGAKERHLEVAEISRMMKSLAKELRVPVIVLSQLNRSLEQRQNKRPVMADLRESGAIEQDADLIMFIYRDEVYNKDNPENKGQAEIIIGKHRNGPTGTVQLYFRGEFTRFEELDDTYSDYM